MIRNKKPDLITLEHFMRFQWFDSGLWLWVSGLVLTLQCLRLTVNIFTSEIWTIPWNAVCGFAVCTLRLRLRLRLRSIYSKLSTACKNATETITASTKPQRPALRLLCGLNCGCGCGCGPILQPHFGVCLDISSL